MIAIEPSVILRTMLVGVSVITLCVIGARLSKWRDLAPGQRWHWVAVGLLVISAGYGAAESIAQRIPVGWRTTLMLCAVTSLLVSILAPLIPSEKEKPVSTEITPAQEQPWYTRFAKFEPAVWKGIVTALVSIALIWGVDLTDVGERVAQTLDLVGALLPLVGAVWIRGSVTPNAKVVQEVRPDGVVVAGPASPQPDGTVIDPRTGLAAPPTV